MYSTMTCINGMHYSIQFNFHFVALHWLQENVAEFGGDPGSVTLMGHGTGAACTTFLMTSPAVLDGKLIRFHISIFLYETYQGLTIPTILQAFITYYSRWYIFLENNLTFNTWWFFFYFFEKK